MDFARAMRVMRTVRGLSQTELAIITGIGNTYLSLIETARLLPTPEQEEAIRAGLTWKPGEDQALEMLDGVKAERVG
jgi:transcriptional regulator with XRE-family HTH domain